MPQLKRLSLIILPLLMLLLQGCYDFDNPVDPNAENYQGFRSERDGDLAPDLRVVYHANTADSGTVPVDGALYFPGDTATVLGEGTLDHSLSTGFIGWNTAHDGSSTDYPPGATLVLPTYNIVLYAQWDGVSTWKVHYNSNGATEGSAPWDGNTYLNTDTVTAPGPGSMIRMQDGISLRFDGWDTEALGTGTRYQETNTFSLASNLELHAQWDVIGGTGPGGGLVFHDQGSVIDGWRYLEAAPIGTEFFISWGDSLLGELFAVETIIGGGRQNTMRTAALTGNWNGGNYAAMQAELLLSGGFDDWFLPSRDELLAMHDKLHVPLWGGFSDVVYWSSTEAGATGGTTMDFSLGSLNSEGKDIEEQVRAARAFRTPEPTYGVLYLANGADAGVALLDLYHYEPTETANLASEGALVKTGYSFTGWNSASDGSGTAYSAGESVSMVSGNLVLYAQWVPEYTIGSAGPAGGIVFYDKGGYTDGWRYLEASPGDLASTSWSAVVPFDVPGTVIDIGAGPTNTSTVVSALNADSQTGRAAQLADAYNLNGFFDWFLPSRNELQVMWTNLDAAGLLGSFFGTVYWSSTQVDPDNANGFNFTFGMVSTAGKTISSYVVRPVRRF